MSALLIVPLMAFTGLAVDLGAWYARATAIQRTTDAAALAGVASLPSGEDDAEDAALAVAEQNGFEHGANGITVSGEDIGEGRFKVTITDSRVPQYFTGIFRESVTVTRSSVAEYAPPVRMGSPRNFLGTENLASGVAGRPDVAMEGFFLSASSPCAPAEDGDRLLSERSGMFSSEGDMFSWTGCGTGSANPTHDDDGYLYGVRVGDGYGSGSITVEVWDAPYCYGGNDLQSSVHGANTFDTTFTLRAPSINALEGAPIAQLFAPGRTSTWSWPCDSGGMRGRWVPIGTINSPIANQTYTVQVTTANPSGANGRGGSNNFALRARTGSTFRACTAYAEDFPELQVAVDLEECPNIFALENLSIYAKSAGTASFFLASVGPEHSGKTFMIDLFDPGEGGDEMWVQDPNGHRIGDPSSHPSTFDWAIVPRYLPGEAGRAPAGGWSQEGATSIDISGNGTQPGPNRAHTYRYNDRQLRIEIELPDEMDVVYADGSGGARSWWRLEYQFAGSVTDRTTWSVSVHGDPVRLIE